MLELYMIRHGPAGKTMEDGINDDKRPLTKKGNEKMKDIAKALRDQKISFDMILTSPLLRSMETAEIVNDYCGATKEVTITDLLIPGASCNNLIKFLNKFKEAKRIAIIGHEPFLSSFASYCISKNMTSLMKLKKGGILKVEINDTIRPGRCILSALMEPKHIIK